MKELQILASKSFWRCQVHVMAPGSNWPPPTSQTFDGLKINSEERSNQK